MKLSGWFWIGMAIWLVLGLPAFVIGTMWNGGFDPIADAPPYFQTPYEDRSLAANLTWLAAVSLAYLPLILLAGLAISTWRKRKRSKS